MARYSFEPRYRIFAKDYGFLSFATNMSKNIGKNISKNLSGKFNQNFLDHAKQSATYALKTTSKRVIQKKVETSGDLICNRIVDKVTSLKKFTTE